MQRNAVRRQLIEDKSDDLNAKEEHKSESIKSNEQTDNSNCDPTVVKPAASNFEDKENLTLSSDDEISFKNPDILRNYAANCDSLKSDPISDVKNNITDLQESETKMAFNQGGFRPRGQRRYSDFHHGEYYPANQGRSNAFSQAVHNSYAPSNYSYGSGGGRSLNANPFYSASASRWQDTNTRRDSWPPYYAQTMGNSNSAPHRPAPSQSGSGYNASFNNHSQNYAEHSTSRHGYTYTGMSNSYTGSRNLHNRGTNNIPVQLSNRNTAYTNRRQDNSRSQTQRNYSLSTVSTSSGVPQPGQVPRRHSSEYKSTEKRADFQRRPSGTNHASGSNTLQSGLTSGTAPAHSVSTSSALSSGSSNASLHAKSGGRGSRTSTRSAGSYAGQSAGSVAPGLVFQNAAKIPPSKPVVTPTKSSEYSYHQLSNEGP